MELTESYAMTPAASVSGLYFAHPEARYFSVGPDRARPGGGLRAPQGQVARRSRALAGAEPRPTTRRSRAWARSSRAGAMRRLRAVLFDAVGTLILLREPVGETYARFARAHGARAAGRAASTRPSRACCGRPRRTCFPACRSREAAARARLVARARATTPSAPPTAAALLAALRRLLRAASSRHYASARRLAPRARRPRRARRAARSRGLRLGVLSNFDQRLRLLLRELGLHERLRAWSCCPPTSARPSPSARSSTRR